MSDIVLPWSVLVPDNQRHTMLNAKHGKRIGSSTKYRNALSAAAILASAQWRGKKLDVKVALTVTLFEPDKRRRDIANYLKLICDCLVATAFGDDSQIDLVTVHRGPLDRFNPRAEIKVMPL